MALEKKVLPYPFTPPDAGTDPKAVTGLVRADNAHWARAAGVEKRFLGMWEWPYDIEPSFVMTPTAGWAPLFIGKNLRKWNSDTYLFPVMDTAGLSDMEVNSLQGKNDGYYANMTYTEFGDFYLLTRMEWAFVYGIGYGLHFWATTHAKKTNEQIDAWSKTVYPGVFKDGFKTRCVRPVIGYGGTVYCFYIDDTAGTIYYIKADPFAGTLTAAGYETALAGMIHPATTTSPLDAVLMGDGKTICLAYIGTPGGIISRPCVYCLNTEYESFAGSTDLDPAETAIWRIGCWKFDDFGPEYTAMVSWFSVITNTLYAVTVSLSSDIVRSGDGAGAPLAVVTFAAGYVATQVTGVQYHTEIGTRAAGLAAIFVETRKSAGLWWVLGVGEGRNEEQISRYNIQCSSSNRISVISTALPIWSASKASLITKPWLTADKELSVVTTASGKTVLLREGTGVVVGRCLFEKSDKDGYMDGYTANGFVTAVQQETTYADGYAHHFGALRKEGDRYTMCRIDVDRSMARLGLTHGAMTTSNVVDTLFVPNSCPYQWDSQALVEQGFIDTPRFVDVTKDTGGNMVAGTYWYQVVWTWVDATGALHRSAPSQASKVVVSSGYSAVDVRVPACRSSRKTGIKVEVYRTAVNNIEPKLVHTFENDTWLSGDYFDWTDTNADTYLADKQTIYTYGGVLESVAPPPFWVHCVHQGRHFVVDRENQNTHIYYTKALVPGIAVEHSDSFLLRVPPTGGEINAIVSMIDRLVVLKRDAVFVFSGSGPDPSGSNGSWSEPYLVSASIGCDNRKSVIDVPDGVMFRSRQGIVLLTRSMQLTFVGEPVRHWTDNSIISGAVARRDKSCVIWFFSTMFLSSRGPSAICYNWKHNVWTTWSGDRLLCDSVAGMYDDRIWMVDALRTRYSADNYAYDLYYHAVEGLTKLGIPLALETGWIPLAGPGGYGRLYRVFLIGQQIASADKIRLQIAYDYDGYYSEMHQFNTSTGGLQSFDFSKYYEEMSSSSLSEQGCLLEATPARQKATAVKFRIYDVPDAYGENWSATALALVVGVKPQGQQNPSSKAMTKTL